MNEGPDSLRTGSWQEDSTEVATIVAVSEPPRAIGRYRTVRALGQGAFGVVYLAHDGELERLVAIKVPRQEFISRPEHAESYRSEARTVARLDHPHIVPVFDVGSTDDLPFFIVSKYVDGRTLAATLREKRLPVSEIINLVASLAEALHYAHRMGFVHRDIKPGNVLLDAHGKPYITDFGLALKDTSVGKGPRLVGTPHYMSPEQARGEGHRVDGRSDVFSLGVVLYELLTGKRPFHGDTRDELMEQITSFEARPIRQMDESIPKELERICFKALSKRIAERYMTAQDLADDLRQLGAQQSLAELPKSSDGRGMPMQPGKGGAGSLALPHSGFPSTALGSSSPQTLIPAIVPKGLRCFDAGDADFFLELLPGPRDREGLPDTLRFWKTRIEETDADATFAIGLIYGPSGCGKTSLVKAGLLPRIADHVVAIYAEAAADTEARLLRGLRKRCPGLPSNVDFRASLTAIRRGEITPPGTKVLIVLDQFEQWLHCWHDGQRGELVQALRQCDGGRVQCIVMVRDDFWMATTRFMRDLEVDLAPGRNIAAVDLFDLRHARKVLIAFGRAFGALPHPPAGLTEEQKPFVELAVNGLAEEGRIICVRLALFAEMMKDKPWTPASLKAIGGAEGVGVAFLEKCFSSPTASPTHRLHQKAARAILKALLPDSGTDIKGHVRSATMLQEVSGYEGRQKDFEDLMRLLESELRLITPTDDETVGVPEKGTVEGVPNAPSLASRQYQLTHDYLVRSVRDWLERKQKETRRGRAELMLADRAAAWNARPENRQLPSLAQWATIRLLTLPRTWNEQERKMMRRANQYHGLRTILLASLVTLAAFAGLTLRSRIIEQQRRDHAAALVQRVLDAHIAQVPGIIAEIEPYRAWADSLLREANAQAADDGRQRLHTSLALLPVEPSQREYLYDHLIHDCDADTVAVIRDALYPFHEQLRDRFWAAMDEGSVASVSFRLRAGSLLANYDPAASRWLKHGSAIAEALVSENPLFLGIWLENFRPVKEQLVPPLVAIFRDRRPERATERMLATRILADYGSGQPELLGNLLMDADPKQWLVLYPLLVNHNERGAMVLESELGKRLPAGAEDQAKEELAKRQANAGAALERMNRAENVWPLLRLGPDPRLRTYLIHCFHPLRVPARPIAKRLAEDSDVTARRALLLILGTYGAGVDEDLDAGQRDALVQRVRELYRENPDAGLHGASEWMLKRWRQEAWLKTVREAWTKDDTLREQTIGRIKSELTSNQGKTPPSWYVNGQGQTMVVIPGPAEFMMGSPPNEAKREPGEILHPARISRSYALAAKPVTVEEFLRFRKDHDYQPQYAPTVSCPAHLVTWYLAAEYCNWLSKQEGLPEEECCYLPNREGKFAEGMKLAPNWRQRGGYRLPTEAEWEYACRAHTVTSRYFGESEDLVKDYGWYLANAEGKQWPVGAKMPNDWGLFDTYGNAFNWCQDKYVGYAEEESATDRAEDLIILDRDERVMRGSSHNVTVSYLRSAQRFKYAPTLRSLVAGLRPARTFK